MPAIATNAASESSAEESNVFLSPLQQVADLHASAYQLDTDAVPVQFASAALCADIRRSIIGDDFATLSSIGPRKLVYADSTASGRASHMIERVVLEQVLPLYANTHTTTSYTGFSAQHFLDESRSLLSEWVRASERDHVLLFTGRGSTEASNRLAHYLLGPTLGPSRHYYAQPGDPACLACLFPGCGRSFPSRAEFILHGRGHADGEASLQRALAMHVAGAGAGVDSAQNDAQAAPVPAHAHVTVLVGPRAHHSSFLPFAQVGCHVRHLPEPSSAEAAAGLGISMLALLQALVEHHTAPRATPGLLIVILTYASNVTGEGFTESGAQRVSAAVHAMGGVDVWDCAASAPHCPPTVDPHTSLSWDAILGSEDLLEPAFACTQALCKHISHALATASRTSSSSGGSSQSATQSWTTSKDAVFFSMHKLVGGGAGSPGILLMRRPLFGGAQCHALVSSSGTGARDGENVTWSSLAGGPGSRVSAGPFLPGGGTVFFVDSKGSPVFSGRDAEREEGGSPDVTGCARAGLMVHMLRAVGSGAVQARESAMAYVARAVWARNPALLVYGQTQQEVGAGDHGGRMPIVSLAVLAGGRSLQDPNAHTHTLASTPLLLHWGLVCAMLNDLFGIQARGGCLCAGPYSQYLLGMALDAQDASTICKDSPDAGLLTCLLDGDELLRPGFVRLSFTYHMSVTEWDFIVRAVDWIALHGAELMCAGLYVAASESGEWRMHRAMTAAALACAYRDKGREGGGAAVAPRDVIARFSPTLASTTSNGSPSEDVKRGGARAAPRPWLQAVHFGAGTVSGEAPSPLLPRNTVPVTAQSCEDLALLFQAYLDEADLLVSALSPSRTHNPVRAFDGAQLSASALLHTKGQGMRWFALPEDFEEATDLPEPGSRGRRVTLTTEARCHTGPSAMFPHPPHVALFSTMPMCVAASASAHGLLEAVAALGPGSAYGAKSLSTLLSSQHANEGGGALALSLASAVRAFDGETGTSPAVGPVATSTATTSSAGKTAADRARVNAVEPTRHPVGGEGEGRRAVVRASPRSSARPPTQPPPALTPLEYVWRRQRVAATTTALAAIPRPGTAVCRSMSHALNKAILQFGMLKHGDRVLVGLSGGKDSLTLLLELLRLQALAPVWFEVGACTVDPQYEGAYDPAPLAAWCEALGVEYTIEAAPVLELAGTKMDNDSLCAFCSRLKRGILYGACRRRGYNVLALGQHLDDFAESFVMSAFQNGLLRTMKAHYANEAGDVRIIRPLCYVRERDTRAYAHAALLPVIPENCPGCFTAPQVRYAVKKLLAREEGKNVTLFSCLAQAIQPLMTTSGARAIRASIDIAAGPGLGILPLGAGLGASAAQTDEGKGGGPVSLAGQTVQEEVEGVAPAGFVPAKLSPPAKSSGGGQQLECSVEEEGGGEGGGAVLPWQGGGVDEDDFV